MTETVIHRMLSTYKHGSCYSHVKMPLHAVIRNNNDNDNDNDNDHNHDHDNNTDNAIVI